MSLTYDSTFIRKGVAGQEREIPFRQYYTEQYDLDLRGEGRGLLVYVPPRRSRKCLYLILELCHLTGMSDEIRSNQPLTKR